MNSIYEIKKSFEIIEKLNCLLNSEFSKHSEIELTLTKKLQTPVNLYLDEIIEKDDSDYIYRYDSIVNRVPISIYIGANVDSHSIVAVSSGNQKTFLNEDIKNQICS